MKQRLKHIYHEQIIPKLLEQLHYRNIHQIPKLNKIVVNRGLGEAAQNTKILESSISELKVITTQSVVVTRSRKAIAGFKIREKRPVGITVILRNKRMYAFIDRLVNLALPRIRDFQGVNPNSFDGHGNYNFGLDEQLIFPEISYDQVSQLRGIDVCIVTTSNTDKEGFSLLKILGIPFKKNYSLTL
jgi:large subunit ribosomal protein L5